MQKDFEDFVNFCKESNLLMNMGIQICVIKLLSNKIDVLFDIDWQGTQQLKKIKDLKLVTFAIFHLLTSWLNSIAK